MRRWYFFELCNLFNMHWLNGCPQQAWLPLVAADTHGGEGGIRWCPVCRRPLGTLGVTHHAVVGALLHWGVEAGQMGIAPDGPRNIGQEIL